MRIFQLYDTKTFQIKPLKTYFWLVLQRHHAHKYAPTARIEYRLGGLSVGDIIVSTSAYNTWVCHLLSGDCKISYAAEEVNSSAGMFNLIYLSLAS
ncbi:hypothetical protein J6590_050443 [Homalodisca vitripennis]|nr:hypothetical protein J6590_050443 [Homalodisca vitripennis]